MAVCCAALDVCCRESAHALSLPDDGGADGTCSDGSMSYEAYRAEKLALLREWGLACDDAPAGGPATVWVTQDHLLPMDLLKAAQVCHANLRGVGGVLEAVLSSHKVMGAVEASVVLS